MNTKLKFMLLILLIFSASIFISIIVAPIGGIMHSNILGSRCSGGLFLLEMFDSGCEIEGFIYFYIFFLSLLSFLFLKQKMAWILFFAGTFIIWLGYIYIIAAENLGYLRKEYIGSLVIMLGFFAIGYGLAFLINAIKNKKSSH